jgi:GNAT superfamily N-acetyltransferase
MTIREATLADVPRLVAMGEQFLGSVYRGLIQGDAPTLTRFATHLVESDASVVYVAERDARIVGMIGLMRYPHPMSGETTAAEVMWWVDPAHRGCGLRLFRAGERWATAQGARVVQMIAPTVDVERLYTRLGYGPVERVFQKRIA